MPTIGATANSPMNKAANDNIWPGGSASAGIQCPPFGHANRRSIHRLKTRDIPADPAGFPVACQSPATTAVAKSVPPPAMMSQRRLVRWMSPGCGDREGSKDRRSGHACRRQNSGQPCWASTGSVRRTARIRSSRSVRVKSPSRRTGDENQVSSRIEPRSGWVLQSARMIVSRSIAYSRRPPRHASWPR